MDRRTLIELKFAMEFGVAPVGDTLPEARANVDGYPRLLVSRFKDGDAVFFRHDVPPDIVSQLSMLGPTTLIGDEERVKAILAHDAPCETVYRVRWYTIERTAEPTEYPDVTIVDGCHVILVDGAVVAWAKTDCENEFAAEVSIETHEAFRRLGYARQVTAAWAAQVLSTGRIGFYSHLLVNAPSQAVAESLGLVHLSDEVEYI